MYILMVDSLSRKLTVEKHVGTVPGIRPIKGLDLINHALFTDDSLLLGGASIKIKKVFRQILQNFCNISGALVNKRKNVVFGWNIDQHSLH